MNIRDEQYLCSRVSTIDCAVGGLQNKVEEQQELIEKLTKRIDKVEGKLAFWFCHGELSDKELEKIQRDHECDEEQGTKEGGDDETS